VRFYQTKKQVLKLIIFFIFAANNDTKMKTRSNTIQLLTFAATPAVTEVIFDCRFAGFLEI
jgi:hypothetical protein